jgi:hypothetical protein
LGLGNPACSKPVKDYLADVREEQLKARVTPRQAEPVLLSDIETVSQYIEETLAHNDLDAIQLFVWARDQAFFKALFFSADRAADLLGTVTTSILRFPDNSGFLLNHMWTKTLRSGDTKVFALKRGSYKLVCPVRGIEIYFKICEFLRIDISSGYLFRSVSKTGVVTPAALEPSAAQSRLDSYVAQLTGRVSSPRFTLHGFRSGAAIS